MTLYLVRHGSAGMRHDGDPTDTERHLDDVGEQQAVAIATALGVRTSPIKRLISSQATRCRETLAPLAAALALPLEVDDALFEGTDIVPAWKLMESLASDGVTAALCSHGDVIPELIRRARMRGMETSGSGCKKGSIWELHWDGQRFSEGKYIAIPS